MHEAVRVVWAMGQKGHAIQITEDSRGGKFLSAQVHHYLTCKRCEKEVNDGKVERDRKVAAIEAEIGSTGKAGGSGVAGEDRFVQGGNDRPRDARASQEIFNREGQEKAVGGGSFALLNGDGSDVAIISPELTKLRDAERTLEHGGDGIRADRGVPGERGQGSTSSVGDGGGNVRIVDGQLSNTRWINKRKVNQRAGTAARRRGISKIEGTSKRRKRLGKRRVKKNGKR